MGRPTVQETKAGVRRRRFLARYLHKSNLDKIIFVLKTTENSLETNFFVGIAPGVEEVVFAIDATIFLIAV